MQTYFKKITEMEHLNKLFDCIRLIDMQFKNLLLENHVQSNSSAIPKFDCSERQDIYKQCLDSNKTFYHIKREKDCLLIYAIIPTSFENKRFIMECIANITDKLDINQCHLLYDNLYKLSITDELTGIYNRRYINTELPISITDCAKNNVPLSVIFTDLDSFKAVNDLYGHEAGDYVLREFASILQENIRENNDWVARYGGDEFLLCMIGVNNSSAKIVAERIRKILENKEFIYHGHSIKITSSTGVHTIDCIRTLTTYDVVLKEVDLRLYDAKKSGRNTVK